MAVLRMRRPDGSIVVIGPFPADDPRMADHVWQDGADPWPDGDPCCAVEGCGKSPLFHPEEP